VPAADPAIANGAATQQPAARRRLPVVAREGALVLTTSALVTVAFFRVGWVSWSTPVDYAGDAVSEAAFARIIIETGWTTHTNRLGAPTGLTLYDFPLGADNLHNLILKVMSWFIRDPVSLVNAYFLLGFVLVAVAAYAVLRALRLSVPLALTGALLFSFAPFHMIRGTAHLTLGAYFSVPLICWLALRLAHGDPVFATVGPGRRLRLAPGWLLAAVLAVVIGSSGAYYALMAVPLLAVAGLVGAWRAGRGSRLSVAAGAAAVVVVSLGAVAANNLPSLLFQRAHGTNPQVDVRYPWEVDDYALRPIDMLAPVPGHHLAPLRTLSSKLTTSRSISEPSQFLGAVTALGMVLAVAWALARGAARAERPVPEPGRWRGPPEPQVAGLLIVVAVLVGVTGGLSWIGTLVGLGKVRAWNRISIVVAFLGLVALLVLVERLLARRRLHPVARPVLAVALVALGLFDQTGGLRLDPRATRAAFEADAAFVHQIEATLPPGSMVFQLPWQPFPEQPPQGSMSQYDQLKPFLHSATLRWSFGGMRGRESDWQEAATRLPPGQMLDAIVAVGFSGLYIDRAGYVGGDADRLVAAVQAALGPVEPLTGDGGRLVFFDLRPHHDDLVARLGPGGVTALSESTLHVPTAWWTGGFWFEERPYGHVLHYAPHDATMEVFNRAAGAWHGTLEMQVRSAEPGPHRVDVTVAGSVTHLAVTEAWTDVALPLTLAPGTTTVRFHSDAPVVHDPGDPRALVFAVQDPSFVAR